MEDKKLDELWSLISRVGDIDRITDDGMTALGSVFGQMRKTIVEQREFIEWAIEISMDRRISEQGRKVLTNIKE